MPKSNTTRNILIGCGSGSLLLIIVAVVGGVYAYHHFISPFKTMLAPSPAMQQPGVKQGVGFLVKSGFVSLPRLNSITDLAYGDFDSKPGAELAVAGYAGALLLDKETLQQKSAASFVIK